MIRDRSELSSILALCAAAWISCSTQGPTTVEGEFEITTFDGDVVHIEVELGSDHH